MSDPYGLGPLLALSRGSARIRIALIDGPVARDHPALAGARLEELPGGAPYCEIDGGLGCLHGTLVAGVLAAARESGAPAIAPATTLLLRPLFCDRLGEEACPLVTLEGLAAAIDEVVAAGAQIINLSVGTLGERPESASLAAALDRAQARGVLVVAAAGNPGSHHSGTLIDHPWVIPVVAGDAEGRPLADSNRGPAAAARGLLAPGREVPSLNPAGGLAPFSGTSAAAPFVSGVAALLMALHPQRRTEEIRRALLRPEVPRDGTPPPRLNGWEAHMQLTTADEAQTAAVPESIPEPTPESTPMPAAIPAHPVPGHGAALMPQADDAPAYVYAMGTVRVAFPTRDVEQEYLAAASTLKLGEEDFYGVLSPPGNRYLARAVCWLLEIGNVDSYLLLPRSPTELGALIETLKPLPQTPEPPLTIIIGPRGPLAAPEQCHGLEVPQVLVNQLYFFDYASVIKNLTAAGGIEEEAVVGVLKAMEMKPNPGSADADRALNYIAYRFPEIYQKATELRGQNQGYFLRNIATRPAALQGARRIVDVIFNYQQYDSGEQVSWYCSIDVTGQFPFVNTKLRQYIPEGGSG